MLLDSSNKTGSAYDAAQLLCTNVREETKGFFPAVTDDSFEMDGDGVRRALLPKDSALQCGRADMK
jgi:hypothetical protein